VEHGARPAVLAAGAVLGLTLGVLVAWRFGPAARRATASQPAT